MHIAFDIDELTRYVDGTICCPNVLRDPVGTSNWCCNDSYAKMLITNNITQSEEGYVSHCTCRKRSSRHLEFQLSREQVLVNLP